MGPIRGILVAFVLSLINLARNAAHPPIDILHGEEDPHVSLHDSSEVGETAPGLLVVRFAAPIFFANSEVLSTSVRAMVAAAPHPVKALVLDLEAVTDLDVTGAEALADTMGWLRGQGITVGFSRVRVEVRARLEHFGCADATEYATNRAALAAYKASGESGPDEITGRPASSG